MLTKRYLLSLIIAGMAGGLAVTLAGPTIAIAHGDEEPTPIGAWFGVARPCTPDPKFNDLVPNPHPAVDQEFCKVACGGHACPQSQFPVPEVTMIPTLLADGTVLADDFAAVGITPGKVLNPFFPGGLSIGGDGHSTAHGKYAFLGRERVGGRRLDRYQATFIWFLGRSPGQPFDESSPVGFFGGSIRPRFTTFFDKRNPDLMKGFIQPFFYPYTKDNGIVRLQANNIAPLPDPIAPLPDVCDPDHPVPGQPFCFGTLMFNIRRITAF